MRSSGAGHIQQLTIAYGCVPRRPHFLALGNSSPNQLTECWEREGRLSLSQLSMGGPFLLGALPQSIRHCFSFSSILLPHSWQKNHRQCSSQSLPNELILVFPQCGPWEHLLAWARRQTFIADPASHVLWAQPFYSEPLKKYLIFSCVLLVVVVLVLVCVPVKS